MLTHKCRVDSTERILQVMLRVGGKVLVNDCTGNEKESSVIKVVTTFY